MEAATSLKEKVETDDEYSDMKGQNITTWQNGQNLADISSAIDVSVAVGDAKTPADMENLK